MTPGGADGQRGNGKGKSNALPSDYVPPGGVRTNMRDASTLGGSLSGSPALNAAASGQPLDAESLKAEVEALRLRLTAQQAPNRSLAEANDELIASVEAMRREDVKRAVQWVGALRFYHGGGASRKGGSLIRPRRPHALSTRRHPHSQHAYTHHAPPRAEGARATSTHAHSPSKSRPCTSLISRSSSP